MRIERLKLKKLNNTRDLGGFPAAGGKRIKYGKLIRSGNLYKLPDGSAERLKKIGLATVADMRIWRERLHPDREIEGVKRVVLPVDWPEDSEFNRTDTLHKIWRRESKRLKREFKNADEFMLHEYERLLFDERAITAWKEFFKLALENEGCLLWHCRIGKDRTGVAAMLIEYALGVDEDIIIADYTATDRFMRAKRILQKAALLIAPITCDYRRLLYALMDSKPEYITYAMQLLKERYGGVIQYCKQVLGLTDEDIEALREKYLE